MCGYVTGVRKDELTLVEWSWVDLEAGFISVPNYATKNGEGRNIPILAGDMRNFLTIAKQERDDQWPESPWVFNRQGNPILDFRGAWEKAVKAAGVPDLTFHDLRRTAVRNMRRAGVPQVIRMKVSGHKTDSMERRSNIVDTDDLEIAKRFMEACMTGVTAS